ncbi:MAG TPA: tRNA (adenosine(37)-N6)-threonylcarbamoyltransferase complex dimerization subunit type 1 TsaB [Pyrinomonadaceae bacterium]
MSINERPLILTIETATRAGSVALNAGAQLVASRVGSDQTSHSTNLLQDIGSLLKEAGIGLHRVDLFAAASGPGSFTGLRIGLATVKSFAATLERPCLGVPTLTAIAHGAGISRQTMALLPAGRGELFAQLLRVDENDEVTPLTEAAHLAPRRVLDMAKKIRPLKWAGEGAHLQREAIRDFAERHEIAFLDEACEGMATLREGEEAWTLAPPTQILAASVAQLALRRFNSGETERAQDLRAIYVRASDAELKERCQEQRLPS